MLWLRRFMELSITFLKKTKVIVMRVKFGGVLCFKFTHSFKYDILAENAKTLLPVTLNATLHVKIFLCSSTLKTNWSVVIFIKMVPVLSG